MTGVLIDTTSRIHRLLAGRHGLTNSQITSIVGDFIDSGLLVDSHRDMVKANATTAKKNISNEALALCSRFSVRVHAGMDGESFVDPNELTAKMTRRNASVEEKMRARATLFAANLIPA